MKRRWVYLAISIALTALIFFTSTRTGEENGLVGGRLINWISKTFFQGSLSQLEKDGIVFVGSKFLGHFSLYALDGLFFYLALRLFKLKRWVFIIILITYSIFIASMGEIIQISSPGRYPAIHDVFLDLTGFLMPVLIIVSYRRYFYHD